MSTSPLVPDSLRGKCLTCLGTGDVGSLHGPVACTDCDGSGKAPRRHLLTERRLREIETRFCQDQTQAGIDLRWLAFEVRRAREALMKVLTMTDSSPIDDRGVQQLWHHANDVLGVYEPEGLRAPDPKNQR